MNKANSYQSIVQNLSLLSEAQLNRVNQFIQSLKIDKTPVKEKQSFAGIWADMPEEDFQDLLSYGKQSGEQLFSGNSNL